MNNKHESKETQITGKPAVGSQPDLIGKQIGDYKINREIGHGGMAVVYEAYQQSLDRNVAVKIIPKALVEDPEYLERFKREAASAAKLNHPNIVSIHGFGQFGDTYYYVMDLAKGRTLDNIIETKKNELLKSARQFNIDDALKIITQTASALGYAHKEGVIHRDIKPGNLMIDEESGRVLITDFGLARSTRWEKITPRASLFGTPAYMSPEQAGGKELDQRTDIYSLGAVLYEMLTGKVPYPGNNALEVIDKVKTEPIVPPAKLNPNIPHGVESIILKAMSKDIRLRYKDMDELIYDIKKYQRGAKITTFARIAGEKAEKEMRRKRLIPLIPLLVLILLGAVFGIYLWQSYYNKKKETAYINSKLQLAENYKRLGMHGDARKIYEEIITKYPDTEYAAKAMEGLSR